MIDVCGELSFHVDNEIDIDAARLLHLKEVFACFLYTLELKGWNHLDTWIPPDMDKEIRFAENFGFAKTGMNKVIYFEDGQEQVLTELRINF
jgi:hypothetical protein